MSCGCGKLPKGNFSSQKDTWSRRSNLGMGSWDPYPELQNPKNVENYCNCSMKDCGIFKVEQNRIDSGYVPLQQSVVMSGMKITREGYADPCCKPTAYNNLDQTWNSQKPYNL